MLLSYLLQSDGTIILNKIYIVKGESSEKQQQQIHKYCWSVKESTSYTCKEQYINLNYVQGNYVFMYVQRVNTETYGTIDWIKNTSPQSNYVIFWKYFVFSAEQTSNVMYT